MKQCGACQSNYSDDDDYCPLDGSVLRIVLDRDRPGSSHYVSANIPTQIIHPVTPAASTINDNPTRWRYVILGALGALIIAGTSFFIWRGNTESYKDKFTDTGRIANSKINTAFPVGNTSPQGDSDDGATGTNNVSVNHPPVKSPLAGRWVGDWSSPSGAYLTIVMDLNDDGTGSVTGEIKWTLRRTTRPEKIDKIGLSATEFVNGRFDSVSRTLNISGYRKYDPNNVLVMLDSYRLNLSGDTHHLNGSARNGGKWNARVNLAR